MALTYEQTKDIEKLKQKHKIDFEKEKIKNETEILEIKDKYNQNRHKEDMEKLNKKLEIAKELAKGEVKNI